MKGNCLLVLIMIVVHAAFGLSEKKFLSFQTSKGHVVKVIRGQILYDKKLLYKLKYDDILYSDKSNRLIEHHGSVILFIAISGRPNLDRLNAFLIEPSKATLIADAILSPVKDYDGDGYLEFGGSDLTEMYPNADSMYYVPNVYYEIRAGKIHPDNALTKREDIKLNGLYLSPNNQRDKDGYCCKVVPTPKIRH